MIFNFNTHTSGAPDEQLINANNLLDSLYNNEASGSIDLLEAFLKEKYEFRHNTVTGNIEYRLKDSKDNYFKVVTDRDENTWWRMIQKNKKLQQQKAVYTLSYLRNLLVSEFSSSVDPIEDYIKSLPEWDHKTDYIKLLADTIKTDNDTLFYKSLKIWLVAVVASCMRPENINHTALIFSGKQGIGKSTWILKLVPSPLNEYVYTGTINPNNKDTLIHMATNMLINLDELENLNSTEIGAIKEIITKPQIKLRRPYGRNTEDLPRRASFAGSVNSAQFLNDSTGSRRFLCFEALEIEYNHGVDMDKVYAQAYALYRDKFRYWLNDKDIKELEESNSKFQRTTVEEDLLLNHFKPAREEDAGCLFYNATGLAAILASSNNGFTVTNATTQRLGRALKKHEFKTYKRDGIQKYAVLLKLPQSASQEANDGVGKAG